MEKEGERREHPREQLEQRDSRVVLVFVGPAHRSRLGEPPDERNPMIKEFRDFLLRRNIVELAVAFVIGLAFAAVVNSPSAIQFIAIAAALFCSLSSP
jgi:hypothetical protein